MTNLFASCSMGNLQKSTSYSKNNHRFKMLILNVQNMTIECISKIKIKIFKLSHAVTKLMTCSSEANALTESALCCYRHQDNERINAQSYSIYILLLYCLIQIKVQCTSLYGGVQRLFRHSMTQINHLDLISLPLQWRATTSSLYLVSGVFSGNLGEMFIRLPLVLYSFRMSSLFASAAARNVSVNINQKIPCTFFFDRLHNIHLVIFTII